MEFKGTKGEWSVRFMTGSDDGENDFFIHAPNEKLSYGTEIMMEDFGEHNGYPRKQRLADAELIAEAGNVRQKIDCSLTELLQQRNELLESLKNCRESLEWCAQNAYVEKHLQETFFNSTQNGIKESFDLEQSIQKTSK